MMLLCDKTKEEILEIIIDELKKTEQYYDDSVELVKDQLVNERTLGRFVAMRNLVDRLNIYQK